ncbi:MAG: hypothetical protein Q8K45_15690 [Rubrivivax sp.]|nr:hypothetical protein [Rubrivivax sp.]
MSTDPAEFSALLWAVGVFVAALAVYLGQGWVHMARRSAAPRRAWRALLVAAAVLGVGLTSALEVGMQAHALPFPVGYRWLAVAVLVGVAVLACAPAVVVAAGSSQVAPLLASGGLLAAAVLGLDAGWVWAAGFRPGVVWRLDLVLAAAVLAAAGLAVSQWLAFAPAFQDRRRRRAWRVAAALLAALTLMLGQQVMSWAAGLHTQVVSSHLQELPGWVLSLVCGALVPLVLVALLLDLWLRRQQRREHHDDGYKPQPRRKRRHKVRTL